MDVGAGRDEEGKMALEGSHRRPSSPASYSACPFSFALHGADWDRLLSDKGVLIWHRKGRLYGSSWQSPATSLSCLLGLLGPSRQPFRDFHSLALVQTSFRGFGLFRHEAGCLLSPAHAAIVLGTVVLVPILQMMYLDIERLPMMMWQVSGGGAETWTQDFCFKTSMALSPPPVPTSTFALSAAGEWVTSFSHSDFTPDMKHYLFSVFPALYLNKAKDSLGSGERQWSLLLTSIPLFLRIPQAVSELRAGNNGLRTVGKGLASGEKSRGLNIRRKRIFSSGLLGGPTGFVCTAFERLGWPQAQELHSFWEARRCVATLQLNYVSSPLLPLELLLCTKK